MDNKTRIKRLKELEYMLLNHKEIFKEKGIIFNLESWATKVCDFASAKILQKNVDKQVIQKNMCGTAACALGSAALYEPFIKQGLKMVTNDVTVAGGDDEDLPYYEYVADFSVEYKGLDGEDAGAAFFGITMEQSENLFFPFRYENENPTAKQVAARVKDLIKQYS